jgi:hypothetical protein
MCGLVMPLAEHAGCALPHLAVAIVSWFAAEVLAGCAAYATAMYPQLALDDFNDPVAPKPSEPKRSEPGLQKRPKPDLRVVSGESGDATGQSRASRLFDAAQCQIDLGADTVFQREQKPGAGCGWRAAIMRAAIGLLSKIRGACAGSRARAQRQGIDERLFPDIGASGLDIKSIARYGGRSE